jgi:hypothetical protein
MLSIVLAAVGIAPVALAAAPGTIWVERHHYSIDAIVKPFPLLRITSRDVGDAVVVRRRSADRAGYSLLIGSDPGRASRGINRWGYLREETMAGRTELVGLMTEADAQSVEEAEASLKPAAGQRRYELIRAVVDGGMAHSEVSTLRAPEQLSMWQLGQLLTLMQSAAPGADREIRVTAGTQSGFLVALDTAMERQVAALRARTDLRDAASLAYVYHGRVYRLRSTHAEMVAPLNIGGRAYERVIAADYEIRNVATDEITRFSMTFGTDGALARVPIAAAYQPRWWMRIELSLDDAAHGPAIADTF